MEHINFHGLHYTFATTAFQNSAGTNRLSHHDAGFAIHT